MAFGYIDSDKLVLFSLADITRAGVSTSEIVTVNFSSNMSIRLEFGLPPTGISCYAISLRGSKPSR